MSMHSIQDLEHGLAAAFRSLIYAKHRHGAQEEEDEEEEGVHVHVPHVVLKILSFLPLPDLYRMRCTSRIWRHVLSAPHMWDALFPMASEAQKSCPWILVVDPNQMFNVVHVHNYNEREAAAAESSGDPGHCTKKMRSDIAFTISINIKPALVDCSIDDQTKTKSDSFGPDISVYSSVNPSTGSSSSSTGTPGSAHEVFTKWSTGQPLSCIIHGSGDPCKILVKYRDDAESEASALKPLIPIFPEMAYGNVAQPPPVHASSTSCSLMGGSSPGPHIPEIASIIRLHDLPANLPTFHHEELVASCGGLVCFLLKHAKSYDKSYWDGIGHKVLVLNPLTRACRELPELPAQHMSSLLDSYCRKYVYQLYHYRGLRLTMSMSSTTRSTYFIILHSIAKGPMLIYRSESDSWTFHKTYSTVTTTSLTPILSKCHVLFMPGLPSLNELSGFDAEAGVHYSLIDPLGLPFDLRIQILLDYYSHIYTYEDRSRCWNRAFIHKGRIMYVSPLVFDIQKQRPCIGNPTRYVSDIQLQGFSIWELKEDSHDDDDDDDESIISFVELSRTPPELWQLVTLRQHEPRLHTFFMHNFCASQGIICGTTMTYLIDCRTSGESDASVYSLPSPIRPLVYDLHTNSWTCLPLNTPCAALCGVEPSPWAHI